MKVIFFGTSDYCIPIAESLHKNFELTLVVTRPDKPVGRKGILTPSATKLWSEKNGIKVVTPETLKKDTPPRLELEHELELLKPDVAVVSDYGLIIPEKIFQIPKYGTINVHFSKLPDLRGPSPVQYTLLRGDDEAWITIFKLENPPELEIKMDSGPIIFQQPYQILPDDTTESLYTRLFEKAAYNLKGAINALVKYGETNLTKQDHSKATYSRFISREDGFVEYKDLKNAGREIYNKYRAYYPWPGLWTIKDGKRMKILKCHLEGEKLEVDLVQFEGKNPIKFRSP